MMEPEPWQRANGLLRSGRPPAEAEAVCLSLLSGYPCSPSAPIAACHGGSGSGLRETTANGWTHQTPARKPPADGRLPSGRKTRR